MKITSTVKRPMPKAMQCFKQMTVPKIKQAPDYICGEWG